MVLTFRKRVSKGQNNIKNNIKEVGKEYYTEKNIIQKRVIVKRTQNHKPGYLI